MRRIATILTALTLYTAAEAAFDDDLLDLVAMKAMIENGKPDVAAADLLSALGGDPNNADILNLLGYAHRKMQNWDWAREYYTRALAVAKAHRGALEYMGELELETGNPDAARALLVRLRAACPLGCEELDDLIGAFKDAGVTENGEDS